MLEAGSGQMCSHDKATVSKNVHNRLCFFLQRSARGAATAQITPGARKSLEKVCCGEQTTFSSPLVKVESTVWYSLYLALQGIWSVPPED